MAGTFGWANGQMESKQIRTTALQRAANSNHEKIFQSVWPQVWSKDQEFLRELFQEVLENIKFVMSLHFRNFFCLLYDHGKE